VANHPFLHYRAPKDNSVFSFVHQLTTWHCPHLLLLLLTAGLPAMQQPINISCPPGLQQLTHSSSM